MHKEGEWRASSSPVDVYNEAKEVGDINDDFG
jgi:hypothetical protein